MHISKDKVGVKMTK